MAATTLRMPALKRPADLDQLPVFVSTSMPGALSGTTESFKFQDFFVVLVRGLLQAGGRMIFGGHPTITPLVHQVARAFPTPRIDLYQCARFRGQEPAEAHDSRVFNLHWIESPSGSVAPFREAMTRKARAAVFVGGKLANENPRGGKPGVRDEYERYLRHRPGGPAYLLGLLGGEASNMIEQDFNEPNTLSPQEKATLHQADFPELAVGLILADLRRQLRSFQENGGSGVAAYSLAAKKL
jgi:hypothetical protein